MSRPFNEAISLVVVANDYPNKYLHRQLHKAHPGEYFREVYLRWDELFRIVPEAKKVPWHQKIDFPDPEMFRNTMRLLVESDATPPDLYEDLVAATDGLTLRWNEFLKMVPEAGKIDWYAVADLYPNADPNLREMEEDDNTQ